MKHIAPILLAAWALAVGPAGAQFVLNGGAALHSGSTLNGGGLNFQKVPKAVEPEDTTESADAAPEPAPIPQATGPVAAFEAALIAATVGAGQGGQVGVVAVPPGSPDSLRRTLEAQYFAAELAAALGPHPADGLRPAESDAAQLFAKFGRHAKHRTPADVIRAVQN